MSQLGQVGERLECFVGWRGWNVMQPGVISTTGTVWLPGERAEAVCTRPKGNTEGVPDLALRVPHFRCGCGVYAFKQAEQIFPQGYANQCLLGEVWLWGKVIEHSAGYTAEYAYPKKFYATRAMLKPKGQMTEGLIEYVAFRYDVELEIIPEDHLLVCESPEMKEKERLARVEMEKARKAAAVAKSMKTKAHRVGLEAKARLMPATDPRFANLMEQIEWEATQEVRRRL